MGEGTCVQGDGLSAPLRFEATFYELKYHWEDNKADQAKERCLKLCNKYSWCYAAEVVLKRNWPNPKCKLVTDRPGFEKVYGSNVKYSPWGAFRTIDGITYSTYCGDRGCKKNDGLSSNWDGGSLYSLWDWFEGHFCYRKKGICIYLKF